MNLASTFHPHIQLRSEKVLSENTRGRPRRRRIPRIVCESVPLTLESQQEPFEVLILQATMEDDPHIPDPLQQDPYNNNKNLLVRVMREMVGDVKKKKYGWPPTSQSIFNGVKGCFVGSHGDGETSNSLSGKKLSLSHHNFTKKEPRPSF